MIKPIKILRDAIKSLAALPEIEEMARMYAEQRRHQRREFEVESQYLRNRIAELEATQNALSESRRLETMDRTRRIQELETELNNVKPSMAKMWKPIGGTEWRGLRQNTVVLVRGGNLRPVALPVSEVSPSVRTQFIVVEEPPQ